MYRQKIEFQKMDEAIHPKSTGDFRSSKRRRLRLAVQQTVAPSYKLRATQQEVET